jgi:transcriptional regulator with XRE-family HTH domain
MVVEVQCKNCIAKLREQRGLTVSELARRANLLPQTIAQAELPQREPRRSTAKRIADALGVKVDEVYC